MTPHIKGLFAGLVLLCGCSTANRQDSAYPAEALTSWSHYLGDPGRTHFSTLAQIDSTNVQNLRQVWSYAAGGLTEGATTEIQHNPLVVDSVLYGRSADMGVFAVHAATGERLWHLDLKGDAPSWFGKARGLLRWVSADGTQERIYAGSGTHLYAVDPHSGELDEAFGASGRIDLREDLGRDPSELMVSMNTPGAVFDDLLIIGTRVHEHLGAAPGYVRAYNAVSGALEWTFRTIPLPGEPGHETWPPLAFSTSGGANSWAGMTIDHARGILYVPTGSAAWDWYGGDRAGDNLFANSLLALDARTGDRIWHQQLVKHDLWDRDLPAPPNLVMIEREGRRIPAVAQITKDAHVWVFHRETGEPLYPVETIDVPQSDLLGEWTAPTQRLPVVPEPFGRQALREEDLFRPDARPLLLNIYDPAGSEPEETTMRDYLATLRSDGQFVPPSTQGTIIFPGLDGGGEWGGAAVDPRHGFLFVNGSEMPWIAEMDQIDANASRGEVLFGLYCTRCHAGAAGVGPSLVDVRERLSADSLQVVIRAGRNAMPANPGLSEADLDALIAWLRGEIVPADTSRRALEMPYRVSRIGRFLDEYGAPAVKPPWGVLASIDLNTGEYRWRVPLGNDASVDDPDHPVTGIENYGGAAVTAGGLVFIAATKDEKIRAFNADTGGQLWEADLPAGGYATPAVYEVDGRQYVVIACGGGKMGTASGDRYVAFAL